MNSQNYILEKLYPKQQRLWSKTRGVFRVVKSFNVFVDLLSWKPILIRVVKSFNVFRFIKLNAYLVQCGKIFQCICRFIKLNAYLVQSGKIFQCLCRFIKLKVYLNQSGKIFQCLCRFIKVECLSCSEW